uniref:MAM domain-containing protein n=1 Tax=Steinernema glaseri TaxID=37863 RepID=A0A1I7ZZ01_9BILA
MTRKILHKDTLERANALCRVLLAEAPTPYKFFFLFLFLTILCSPRSSLHIGWEPILAKEHAKWTPVEAVTMDSEEARNPGCPFLLDKFVCRFQGPNAPNTLDGSVDGSLNKNYGESINRQSSSS